MSARLCTMIIFMAVFVLLMNILQVSGLEDDDVLYFEDIQSDQPGKDWDKLPLISQTRTRTDWCEVTPGSVIMVSPSIAFRRWRRWRRSERWMADGI